VSFPPALNPPPPPSQCLNCLSPGPVWEASFPLCSGPLPNHCLVELMVLSGLRPPWAFQGSLPIFSVLNCFCSIFSPLEYFSLCLSLKTLSDAQYPNGGHQTFRPAVTSRKDLPQSCDIKTDEGGVL
jgi:hypothetical protein